MVTLSAQAKLAFNNNPKNIIKYDFPENGKHDYKFWNSEIDNVLDFFIKYGNN